MFRRLSITSLAVLTILAFSQDVSGQGFNLGSKQSTASAANGFSMPTTKPGATSPFQNLFNRDSRQSSEPFKLFNNVEMPKIQWPKLEMPKLTRPSWLPERDPNAPTFFERMNAKSKETIDRFTFWAEEKSSQLRSKQTASWDSIRSTMERLKANGSANSSSSMTTPSRTASGLGSPSRY